MRTGETREKEEREKRVIGVPPLTKCVFFHSHDSKRIPVNFFTRSGGIDGVLSGERRRGEESECARLNHASPVDHNFGYHFEPRWEIFQHTLPTTKLTRTLMESFFLIPDSFVSPPHHHHPPLCAHSVVCGRPCAFVGVFRSALPSVRARLCPRVWRCMCIWVLPYIHSCRKEAAGGAGGVRQLCPELGCICLYLPHGAVRWCAASARDAALTWPLKRMNR